MLFQFSFKDCQFAVLQFASFRPVLLALGLFQQRTSFFYFFFYLASTVNYRFFLLPLHRKLVFTFAQIFNLFFQSLKPFGGFNIRIRLTRCPAHLKPPAQGRRDVLR